jgi:hypothetical protein
MPGEPSCSPPAGPDQQQFVLAATIGTSDEESVHARPVGHQSGPDSVFNGPRKKPDQAGGHDNDHPKEVKLKGHRGHLRLPAYLLIALMIALAATTLAIVAVLVALW